MILSPPITGDAVLDAWTFKLANELNTVILPAIASGALGSGGASASSSGNGNTLLRLYQRTSTSTSPSNPTTCTFDISDLDNTSISANNGWLESIPALAAGNYLWVTSRYVSSSTGTITDANTWDTPAVLSFSGSGSTGLNAIDVVLSSPTISVPADNSGTVTDNSDTGCEIRVFDGISQQDFFIPFGSSTYVPPTRFTVTQTTSGISAGSINDSGLHATIGTLVNFSGATATQTFTINGKRSNGYPYTKTVTRTLSKAIAGPTGVVGNNGDTSKTLYLYAANTSSPTPPGTSDGFNTSTGAPANTGIFTTTVPSLGTSQSLWIATTVVTQTQSSGSFTTTGWTVYQASGNDGANGSNGSAGSDGDDGPRFATRRLYRAGVVQPATPNASINWATGILSINTNFWSETPPLQVATSTTNVWFSDFFFIDTGGDHSLTATTVNGSTPTKSISFSGLVTFNSGDFRLDGSTITSIDGGNITAGSLNVTTADIGNLQVTSAQIDNLTVGTTKIADNAVSTVVASVLPNPTGISAGTTTLSTLWIEAKQGIPLEFSTSLVYNEATGNAIASNSTLYEAWLYLDSAFLQIPTQHQAVYGTGIGGYWIFYGAQNPIIANSYFRNSGGSIVGTNHIAYKHLLVPLQDGLYNFSFKWVTREKNMTTNASTTVGSQLFAGSFSIRSIVK